MSITVFTNCRVCEGGRLLQKNLAVSNDTGRIVDGTTSKGHDTVDLGGAIIGPGLIELQTNGMKGFHFTYFADEQSYAQKVEDVARYLPSTGCTSFYATIPTVSSDDFKKVIIPASALAQIAKCIL
jgi:N-acetylglucosamine-6-phosphate deacetylase